MKLRQKLALVLAASMVVTAAPVVTMAASTNRVTKSLTVAKDSKIGYTLKNNDTQVDKNDVPVIVMELQENRTTAEVFFLKITDGEFADLSKFTGETNATNATVERLSASELKVTVPAGAAKDLVEIPVYAVATGVETVVEVVPEESSVSAGKYVIARTNDAKSTITVGDTSTFYSDGTVADITLEEAYVGAFIAGANTAGDVIVKLTIDHNDFKFVQDTNHKQVNIAVLGRGLATATPVKADLVVDAKDDQVATVTFTKAQIQALNANARGTLKLSGIQVKSTTKTPDTGDFNITVGGDLVSEKTVKVATVADYGVNLKMKDDKAVSIKEGRKDKITFTLAENVNDSMVNGRPVEFTLENGHFEHTTSQAIQIGKVKLGDTTLAPADYSIDPIKKDDDKIGFEFKLVTKTLDTSKIDKITFEDVVVHAPLGNTGDIKLKAEGRLIGEEVETTAVTIKDAVELTSDAMTVKVGLKDQKGGKIVISETEKGNFQKGKTLVFDIEDGCGDFTDKPSVKVTSGDLKLGDFSINKEGQLTVEVKRESKEASTIEITDFVVDVNRSVPQGGFNLVVKGDALTDCGSLEVKDFFVVGTPNTEDVAGVKKVKSVFTIGSTDYSVNGVVATMDAAPYISTDSKTMVPVRFVADAFGVAKQDIIFGDGTVTLLAGTRTIQLKNGSDVAILNGAPVKMAGKVVIKDGRTYAPVAEVGKLLGVPAQWDNATKTATFDNTK